MRISECCQWIEKVSIFLFPNDDRSEKVYICRKYVCSALHCIAIKHDILQVRLQVITFKITKIAAHEIFYLHGAIFYHSGHVTKFVLKRSSLTLSGTLSFLIAMMKLTALCVLLASCVLESVRIT